MTDESLLREFAETGSDAAFSQLYERHAGWVAGAALRRVKEEALAGDVTQAVFIVLARKAKSLGSRTVAPWLFEVTRRTSAAAMRQERTQRRKEREAAIYRAGGADLSDGDVGDAWPMLAEQLESVVDELHASDREAVVLRYFCGKSHEEVAAALRVAPATARKRIERALDKLHGLFARRGVHVPAVAIGESVLRHATVGSFPAAPSLGAMQTGRVARLASSASGHGVIAMKCAMAAMIALAVGTGVLLAQRESPKLAAAPAPAPKTTGMAVVSYQTPGAMQAEGAEVPLPAEIRAALEENAKSLMPITVKWSLTASSPLSEAEAVKVMRWEPTLAKMWLKGTREEVTTLQEGKYREQRWDRTPQMDGSVYAGEINVATDGRVFAMASKGGQLTMRRELVAKQDPQLQWTDGECFDMFGFHPGLIAGELAAHRGPESEVLRRLADGGKLVTVEHGDVSGTKVVRLRIVIDNDARKHARETDIAKVEKDLDGSAESAEERKVVLAAFREQRDLPEREVVTYELDPALHYAMRSRETGYLNGIVTEREQCDDFVQLGQRPVWIARKVRQLEYTSQRLPAVFFKDVMLTWQCDVSEISTEPRPDGDFELPVTTPGMDIVDRTGETEKHFRVRKDGTLKDVTHNSGRAGPSPDDDLKDGGL